jgi:hypothetical protein
VRWITLQALEASRDGGHLVAHVTASRPHSAPSSARQPAEGAAISALAAVVRQSARRLAKAALPAPEAAIALIDGLEDPDELCDLVMANVRCPVADKARYAAQESLLERLHVLSSLLQSQLELVAR